MLLALVHRSPSVRLLRRPSLNTYGKSMTEMQCISATELPHVANHKVDRKGQATLSNCSRHHRRTRWVRRSSVSRSKKSRRSLPANG